MRKGGSLGVLRERVCWMYHDVTVGEMLAFAAGWDFGGEWMYVP